MRNMESRSTKRSSDQQECSPKPDVNYLSTLAGLLKCLVITFNFLSFLCISVGGYYLGIGFSTFVAVIGFTVSLLFLLFYVFHISDNFNNASWTITEMIFCFVWSILNFISGSVLGYAATQQEIATFGWAVAGFFSLSAMCVYGLDCYLKFTNWKRDLPEDGEHV